MKNTLKLITVFFIFNLSNAQTNIVDIDGGFMPQDLPTGTYIKDINNTFTKFLGTWKWQEGNKILIIKTEKVTQYLDPEYGIYEDFIKGNYSYSEDNGITYVVNTISQNLGNNNPLLNSLRAYGVYSQEICNFIFKDALIQKTGCSAKFEFLPTSTTQVKFQISNRGGGYILPDVPPNPNFSIPNNVTLTKQ